MLRRLTQIPKLTGKLNRHCLILRHYLAGYLLPRNIKQPSHGTSRIQTPKIKVTTDASAATSRPAARGVFLVAKDKDDNERRLLLPMKNNIGHDRTGLAFELRSAQVDNPAGLIDTCQVVWDAEAVTVTAEET
jgi:hypothetical protein